MAFRYWAVDRAGASVDGRLDVPDRQGALRVLQGQGLFPTQLEEERVPVTSRVARDASSRAAGAAVTHPAAASHSPPVTAPRAGAVAELARAGGDPARATDATRRGRIARREITAFTRELAALLEATIPVPAALDGIAAQLTPGSLQALIEELAGAVRRGESLSGAMTRHPRVFPGLYTSMVQVGEESGALAPVLVDLSEFLEQQDELRGEVISAIAYPAFVFGLGIVTTVVLLGFVMPRLFGMLTEMMAVLPWPTRILLGASDAIERHGLWIAVLAVAAIAGMAAALRRPAGRLRWDRWKLSLPILGPVFRSAALGRFARTLGTLARSGVSLLPALEIVRHTAGNAYLASELGAVAEETKGGESLAAPLRRRRLFPATMVQMIAVGEETGRLDDLLLKVATIQERLVRRSSRTLVSLLAPAMILVVGALVGFIVISLLLPIFQMSRAMG